MEGTAAARADAVRVAVYWGNTLLDVSQVADPRELTAADVFGEGIAAAGVAPHLKLFSDVVRTKSRVELGALTLIAEPITPATRLPRFAMPEDWSFFKVAAMTGLAMVAVLVAIAINPQDLPTTSDDIIGDTVKIVRTQIPAPKPPPSFKTAINNAQKQAQADPRAIANEPPPEKAKIKGPKGIEGVGILGAIDKGAAGVVLNPNLTNIDEKLAALEGDKRNYLGVGPGGGIGARHQEGVPSGFEGIPIGGGGRRITNGTCVGKDCRHGPGVIGMGALGKHTVIPPSAPKEIIGGLSKDQIQKVVKAHQSEIRYCYETELQRDPSLAGKVTALWEIDPVGGVADVKIADSSLDKPTLEKCLISKIGRWKFPEPIGGGMVTVTYPWVFSSAGQEE